MSTSFTAAPRLRDLAPPATGALRWLLPALALTAVVLGLGATSASARPTARHYVVTVGAGHDPRATAISVGARPKFVYRAALNGFAARLTPRQLGRLRDNPDVTGIEPDRAVGSTATQTMDAAGDPWGLDRIDQASLPLSQTYGYVKNGTGVRAYVIDTGIQADHSEFKLRNRSRAVNVFDAFGGDGWDCYGHGTHVAGTIGGKTYGVAKRVLLRGVRVFDCNGNGMLSKILAGVDWVTANHIKPAIANMSLGTIGRRLDRARHGGQEPHRVRCLRRRLGRQPEARTPARWTPGQGVSPARVKEAYTVAASDKTDTRAGVLQLRRVRGHLCPRRRDQVGAARRRQHLQGRHVDGQLRTSPASPRCSPTRSSRRTPSRCGWT